MIEQEYDSKLLEDAVREISRLPGVGRKTALRFALHLLHRPEAESDALGQSIITLRRDVRYCTLCHNICDDEECKICANPMRDHALVCVVESIAEVAAIERTGRYSGVYHVLGGLISPIDGIGPADLEIQSLLSRASGGDVREVILALSPTMEGDTTAYYIYRRLHDLNAAVAITRPARGLAIGNEIEYTDELTLARSLDERRPIE